MSASRRSRARSGLTEPSGSLLKEKFTEVEGCRVHYWEGGSGFPVLMMHGVGPGTSIVGNFEPVLEPLAERYHVFACDLIGFGASDRKLDAPYFDVDLWVRQGLAMLELMPDGDCGVAGHSLGGALALKVASRSPRIAAVLTSCGIGAPYKLNDALDGFWSPTADKDGLRRAMEAMVADPSSVTDDMIDGRWDLLGRPGYAEYFADMFAPPRQRFIDAAVLSDRELAAITARVMMIHGRGDRPCPPEQTTLVLARSLPRAEVRLSPNCGHNLPRERTGAYLSAAQEIFGANHDTR
jgi:2-hydroxymuconate-semialdehyde hydrolase